MQYSNKIVHYLLFMIKENLKKIKGNISKIILVNNIINSKESYIIVNSFNICNKNVKHNHVSLLNILFLEQCNINLLKIL